MTKEEFEALTLSERNLLRSIERRRIQPVCPACGMEMISDIYSDRGAWIASYICSPTVSGCGAWATRPARHRSPAIAMDRAWERGVSVNFKK